MPELASWFIFLLPLLSFVLITVLRPFVGAHWRGAGVITVAALAAAFALALTALAVTIGDDAHDLGYRPHDWLTVGPLVIRVGIVMDSLTAVMVVVVTGVSLLVQVYGTEYMRGDRGYMRYYAYMSLFTAAMLGLVMASNLVFLYLFWELVGLSSYLLIGFWGQGKAAKEHPAAADAAKKAFIVTRFGDVGFLIAIVWVFTATGTLEISEIHAMVAAGTFAGVGVTWLALGIFAGAVGKSGQFPLHVWLPDAMEGPTPVSALIHAATMVAAGVFLVARFFPIFEASQGALTTVAWIGGGTAIFAASMALVSNDIKRVLAYSTISQLGYMMLALGMGAMGAAIFHLFVHAFFKALLFMGAGSVHHATHTYDMRYMGGLRRAMPWTFGTMLIAGVALVGVFPISGFWSKDSILHAASVNGLIPGAEALYWIGVVTAALTGFYVFRMLFMTFTGQHRGGAVAEAAAASGATAAPAPEPTRFHESPWIMVAPLAVLAVPVVLAGLADLPWNIVGFNAFSMTSFLTGHEETFSSSVAAISSAAGAVGIVIAYSMYVQGLLSPGAIAARLRPVHTLLVNRYYLDYLYERIIVQRVLVGAIGSATEVMDAHLVDRTVNAVGVLGRNVGRIPAALQNGQVQAYGAVISIGLVLILAGFWLWG
ncbi:MAG: NADH-quinone oxidoreductase subunit L [Dehalococcoidia bacterium]